MIIVNEYETIDSALKRFQQEVEQSGILKDYMAKTAFVSKSKQRRLQGSSKTHFKQAA